MFTYPIQIKGLYRAPEHIYFGRKALGPGEDNLEPMESLDLVEHQGIIGDRFFGNGPEFNGHITFFAWEVYQELIQSNIPQRNPANINPGVLRRNVIIEGVDLRSLFGQPFHIGNIAFQGTIHCAPCQWMNHAYGEGALTVLHGRGGLRAQVKSSGTLTPGAHTLSTDTPFDPKDAAARVTPPQLP